MMKTIISLLRTTVEGFPRLATGYRALRDSQLRFAKLKVSPYGFLFAGNKEMEEGKFEKEEVEVVKQYLLDADLFINVGANVGYYCCIALQMGKQTIAFEPMEVNVRCLYRNITQNGWHDNIEIYPIALGKTTGIIEIYGSGTGASLIEGWAGVSSKFKTCAPINTADTILGHRINGRNVFILVDIEGAENQMICGARSLMECWPKPTWLIEICISEHQPAGNKVNPLLLDTFGMFWESGYIARTANRICRLVERDELERIAAGGKDTIGTHNFLFIDKDKHL
jgi:FkbM family methyltransferase